MTIGWGGGGGPTGLYHIYNIYIYIYTVYVLYIYDMIKLIYHGAQTWNLNFFRCFAEDRSSDVSEKVKVSVLGSDFFRLTNEIAPQNR